MFLNKIPQKEPTIKVGIILPSDKKHQLEIKTPIRMNNEHKISKYISVKILDTGLLINDEYHKDYHINNNGFATMAIIQHKINHPFGVVQHEGIQLTKFEEKPSWTTYINAGIYIIDNSASELIKINETLSMPNLFTKIKQKNKNVLIYHMHEDWVDIGTPEEFKKVKNKFKY